MTYPIIVGSALYLLGWVLTARLWAGRFHAKPRRHWTRQYSRSSAGYVKVYSGNTYHWSVGVAAWAAYPMAFFCWLPYMAFWGSVRLTIAVFTVVAFPFALGKRSYGRLTTDQRAQIRHIFVASKK